MKKNEVAFGLCLVAVGAVLLHGAVQLKGLAGLAVGPSLFPNIVGTGLVGVGLIISMLALRPTQGPQTPRIFPATPPGAALLRMAGLFTCISAFALLTPEFGFTVTAAVVVMSFLRMTGVNTGKAVLIAIVTAIVIYLLFDRVLGATLPAGYIEQLL